MSDVVPAKLADTKIRVLNASGQGGQAAEVAGALRDLGFAQPIAANDEVYAGERLQCQGQIRFGPAGRAAAAAVWLVAPCTELFQDERGDDTVDLAIGTEYSEPSHNDDIDAVLSSPSPRGDAAPGLDPADQDPLRHLLSAHGLAHGCACASQRGIESGRDARRRGDDQLIAVDGRQIHHRTRL